MVMTVGFVMTCRSQLLDCGFHGDRARLELVVQWLAAEDIDRFEDLVGQLACARCVDFAALSVPRRSTYT